MTNNAVNIDITPGGGHTYTFPNKSGTVAMTDDLGASQDGTAWSETFEINNDFSSTENGGDQWSLGNGSVGARMVMLGTTNLDKVALISKNNATATVEIYKNDVATGVTATLSNSKKVVVDASSVSCVEGDEISVWTISGSGGADANVTVGFKTAVVVGITTINDISGTVDNTTVPSSLAVKNELDGYLGNGGSQDFYGNFTFFLEQYYRSRLIFRDSGKITVFDGSTERDAILFDKSTGEVTFPNTQVGSPLVSGNNFIFQIRDT